MMAAAEAALKKSADAMADTFKRFVKLASIRLTMMGGHGAAHAVSWHSSDFGIQMENSDRLPVVWLHPADEEPQGCWTVHEYVYDLFGRQWKHTHAPMVMDDFGTLVEVAQ
jgi:hypothetical protein